MARSRSTSDCAEADAAARARPFGRYEPRLRRVIEHVHAHLDEPLSLDRLAELACLSPHHWHRVYHAMMGETLAQTVKRLRLHRAAGDLAHTAQPVSVVATRAGYPNVQSFTRTFTAAYGLSPARFRAEGGHRDFEPPHAALAVRHRVQLRQTDALTLLALPHRGSYMDIGRAFELLLAGVAARGWARPGLRMLGLYHDDPGLVAEADLRSHAALAGCALPHTAADAAARAGFEPITLPAGLHAELLYVGPYASMRPAYRWLFGHWLPAAPVDAAPGPLIEEYLNNPRDTPPHALRTCIRLPVQQRPAGPGQGPHRAIGDAGRDANRHR